MPTCKVCGATCLYDCIKHEPCWGEMVSFKFKGADNTLTEICMSHLCEGHRDMFKYTIGKVAKYIKEGE